MGVYQHTWGLVSDTCSGSFTKSLSLFIPENGNSGVVKNKIVQWESGI